MSKDALLYISDKYGWNTYGIKRYMYELIQDRCEKWLDVIWLTITSDLTEDVARIYHERKFKTVFLASSGLVLDLELTKMLKRNNVTIVGFGFSDPRSTFNLAAKYDCYFSADRETWKEAKRRGIRAYLLDVSVKKDFYRPAEVDQTKESKYDVAFLGNVDGHPDEDLRREWIEKVKDKGMSVKIISGLDAREMLNALAECRYGLHVYKAGSPIPKHILEYASSYLAIIANDTYCCEKFFKFLKGHEKCWFTLDEAFYHDTCYRLGRILNYSRLRAPKEKYS